MSVASGSSSFMLDHTAPKRFLSSHQALCPPPHSNPSPAILADLHSRRILHDSLRVALQFLELGVLALTLGVDVGADFCLILARVLGGALGLLGSLLWRRGLSAGVLGGHFG